MCGFIFKSNGRKIVDAKVFEKELSKISWRGPDASKVIMLKNNYVALGHCRLSVIDPNPRSNQPMVSECLRYYILLNGEIYNHKELRKSLDLVCKTSSDTETLLNGYIKIGKKIFSLIDGMFAVVIYDSLENKWIAARDAFGIKPLFISTNNDGTIISSEAATIARLIKATPSKESINEWEIIRRPLPGYSFFEGVNEVLPGTVLTSDGIEEKHWNWVASDELFNLEKFENLLEESINAHCLSDVENVSLLSGGLDSAIIAKLSNVKKCYTIGMPSNNEFEGAEDTAKTINKELVKVELTEEQLKENWKILTKLKGEPLYLPNEGLIYHVCCNILKDEKVVLTGEGADELLFGYDGIFRWCLNQSEINTTEFLLKYGYSDEIKSKRLITFIDELKINKTPIEFLEDFFYQVHLPGLLRRMDFASMAASKESRVPFVSKKLISYLYRQPAITKINNLESKIPIRKFAEKLGLTGALERKKIGFSATLNKNVSRQKDYKEFRGIIMETLKW